MALVRLEEFEAEWGKRYPAIGAAWRRAWDYVVPFFAFAPGIRKMIYTTDEMDKHFLSDAVHFLSGPFFCSIHVLPPRPPISSAAARRGGHRPAASRAAAVRLGLDRPEHGGMLNCELAETANCRAVFVAGLMRLEPSRIDGYGCRARATSWRRATPRL